MRVTQQMVADGAGVSIATVSRALAGHPAIPAETRRRVEQVARRLGYRSGERQNNRSRRVATAGILATPNAASLLPAVLGGISSAAAATGIGTAVHVLAESSPEGQMEQIGQWPLLAAGGLCGVIAIGWWPRHVLSEMLGTLPLVVIGDGASGDVIRGDAVDETTLLHAELRRLGHRTIGFCHDGTSKLSQTLAIAAFSHAEQSLGSVSPAIVAIADHKQLRQLTISGVTAWICSSPDVADRLSLLSAEAKLRVPGDLSLATLSDGGRLNSNRWTAIDYDWHACGALAMARLQARMAAGPLPATLNVITGTLGTPHSLAPPPGAR